MTAADDAMAAVLAPDYTEKEPAERKRLRYPGNNVDECYERKYFGPTLVRQGPGRVWRIASAEYDPSTDLPNHPGRGTTTAWYAPVSEHELNQVLEQIHQRMNRG